MPQSKQKPATYADLEAAPHHLIAEIIGGELSTRRYFGPRDGVALTALRHVLAEPWFLDRTPEAMEIVLRPELFIGADVVVPELAMWPKGQLAGVDEWRLVKRSPSWVCEFVTPWTDVELHSKRCDAYARYGIQSMWRIEGAGGQLKCFARQERDWLLTHTFTDSEDVNAPPFSELTFSLGLLWPLDEPQKHI